MKFCCPSDAEQRSFVPLYEEHDLWAWLLQSGAKLRCTHSGAKMPGFPDRRCIDCLIQWRTAHWQAIDMASPRLNKGRHSRVGHVYSITTVTCGRRRLFADHEAARIIISEIEAADKQGLSVSLAWVLMPDHLHWLFQLESGSLSAVMQRFKARTAQAINQARQRRESVWQAGFHDHCVRDEGSLEKIVRYLLENPIRAGLVSDIADYPYWWHRWQVQDDLPMAIDAEPASDRE